MDFPSRSSLLESRLSDPTQEERTHLVQMEASSRPPRREALLDNDYALELGGAQPGMSSAHLEEELPSYKGAHQLWEAAESV